MEIVVPKRLILVLLLLMITLTAGGIAYARLPKATILVYPKITAKTTTQVVTLSTAEQTPDFKQYVLPARVVATEVTEEVVREREGSSTREDLAKGVVTLKNEQTKEQPLVAKSHLRHEESGVFFLTDKTVTIPPQGEIAVNVTAKEVGLKGHVPPGKFIVDRLPVSLQAVVYGESSQQFTGGVISDRPITEEEISAAKEEALTLAQRRAVGTLTAEAGGAPLPAELVTTNVTREDVSAAAGSAATSFVVRTTLQAKGFVVDKNDLLSLTLLSLKAMQSDEEEFVSYEPNTFEVKILRSDFERGEARVEGKLTGSFSNKLSSSSLRVENLAGLSAQEVTEHFAQLGQVERAEVSFWPFWVKSVPARAEAIEISVRDVVNEVTVSK